MKNFDFCTSDMKFLVKARKKNFLQRRLFNRDKYEAKCATHLLVMPGAVTCIVISQCPTASVETSRRRLSSHERIRSLICGALQEEREVPSARDACTPSLVLVRIVQTTVLICHSAVTARDPLGCLCARVLVQPQPTNPGD